MESEKTGAALPFVDPDFQFPEFGTVPTDDSAITRTFISLARGPAWSREACESTRCFWAH